MRFSPSSACVWPCCFAQRRDGDVTVGCAQLAGEQADGSSRLVTETRISSRVMPKSEWLWRPLAITCRDCGASRNRFG